MDIKSFLLVFISVFLAELGDKTQLAVFSYSSLDKLSKLNVFIAASLALMLSTGIAIYAASWIQRYVSVQLIENGAGVLFVAIGAWMLIRANF